VAPNEIERPAPRIIEIQVVEALFRSVVEAFALEEKKVGCHVFASKRLSAVGDLMGEISPAVNCGWGYFLDYFSSGCFGMTKRTGDAHTTSTSTMSSALSERSV
jgi:hypothetical protein